MEDSGDDGVSLGTFSRPGFTTLIGIPEDTVYAAEVRSTDGLLNALSSEAPEFFRLLVRDNETIALREDVTVPSGKSLEIEGASGFIVEYGATLTVEPDAFVNNRGDVTIWGDLVIDGSFENSQSLEIGAITGSETATVTVRGYLRNHDHIAVYPTGNIVIDGGSIENYGDMIDVTVTDAGVRDSFSGVRFTEPLTISGLDGDKWVHFHECSFCGDITVIAAENEDNVNVSFSECEFADGLTVTVRVTGDTDCGYNAANLNFGCGETWYHLAPHIFGLGDDPGVYIGICDEAVSYELTLDGEPLPHTTELIPENEKTHFWSDGHGWFTAGQGNAPDLALTVYMPGFPTVIFERVPLKPEWTFGD